MGRGNLLTSQLAAVPGDNFLKSFFELIVNGWVDVDLRRAPAIVGHEAGKNTSQQFYVSLATGRRLQKK